MSKKPTVNIAICAFNEEESINHVIKSLIKQKSKLYNFKNIIIILDGCTDNTFNVINKLKNKKIIIYNFNKRLGKPKRQNFVLNKFSSDYLCFVDADIKINDLNLIDKIIKVFNNDKSVGLICPSTYPFDTKSFISKSIKASVDIYINYFEQINNGNNIYGCKGTFLALSRKFANKVKIPTNIFASDTYLYFLCIKLGFKFKYLKTTKVFYKLPSNFNEHINQNTRFVGSEDNIEKYFGNIVKKEFSKKYFLFIKTVIRQFIKNPFYVLVIMFINLYIHLTYGLRKNKLTPIWNSAYSTK